MLSFPANCKTPADRTEYAYRCQELLRLRHNQIGELFREGKLSQKGWEGFLVDVFEPASNRITQTILEARSSLKKSTRWEIDIEALL